MTANQIIDNVIRELGLFKKMYADPALRPLIRQIVLSEPSAAPAVVPPKASGNSDGVLSVAVHGAIAQMSGQYTYRDVIAGAEQDGYKFKAKNPRSAVTTILNKMVQRKEIQLVTEGKGGQPSVYRNPSRT